MKVKETTLAIGYTYQPTAYHSIKGEASMVVEVGKDDDIDVVQDEMRKQLVVMLVANLAGVEEIHEQVRSGLDPSDLLKEMQKEPDFLLSADSEDFE